MKKTKKKHSPRFELVPRPKHELEQLLHEHLDALASHCTQYDNGKLHFAAEIAINLRVLLYDNANTGSRSLLYQLDKEGFEFLDTVKTMTKGDDEVFVVPAGGLVYSRILENNGTFVQDWCPNLSRLQEGPNFTSTFKTWWEGEILSPPNGQKFSRKRLVNQMANQDRGAHVAPGIEKAYFELTRGNDVGLQEKLIHGDAVTNPNEPIDPSRIVEVSSAGSGQKIARALIRQVAHEVLITLSAAPDAYTRLIPRIPPDTGLIHQLFFYRTPEAALRSEQRSTGIA